MAKDAQEMPVTLPRGVVTRSYGTERVCGFTELGTSSIVPSRLFRAEAGDTVELLDIEDEFWWKVRILSSNPQSHSKTNTKTVRPQPALRPPNTSPDLERDITVQNCAPRQGWIPEENVRLLAQRPKNARMIAGSIDWCSQRFAHGHGPENENEDRCADDCCEDREVAKLLSYQQILDYHRAEGKQATSLFLAEGVFDHPLAHATAALAIASHIGWVWHLSPSPQQLIAGLVVGFIVVDLLSTVYHLCLDYAVLSTADTTVTDLHHKLTLNYNLFSPRKLIATSYVAVAPLHIVHLFVHVIIALIGWSSSPTFTVYTLSVALLGCSCGFVHNAAHRRRHGLEISSFLWFLQDVGVLLHPETHAKHHRGKHDCCFSLFSGVTHPFSDRVLRLAWNSGVLQRTPESFRAKLD